MDERSSIQSLIHIHPSIHPSISINSFVMSIHSFIHSFYIYIYISIGIALGVKLSNLSTQVHAIGVCDTPDIFYEHIEMIAEELGLDVDGKDSSLGPVREW